MKLSPTEIYNGKNVFIIGATGFVGKVALSMLLDRFPGVGHVYVTVRARSKEESDDALLEQRHHRAAVRSSARALRRRIRGFHPRQDSCRQRRCGRRPSRFHGRRGAGGRRSDIDVLINSAGNVTFNPTLESALRTNVVGTQNVIAFAKRMKRPALVHVSTCFVAGNRTGPVWESDPVIGYFPRQEELPGVEFSTSSRRYATARALSERVREEARDALQVARFREGARKRLTEEGRDPDDLDAMGLAVARERKLWTSERLTELGIERALSGAGRISTRTPRASASNSSPPRRISSRAIVRPSIVESAIDLSFPRLERGLHDDRAAHLHRAQGPDADSRQRQADSRHHAC